MNNKKITEDYLSALALKTNQRDIEFLNQLQSRHIAKFSFNSLAVVLKQNLPLDLPALYNKIVINNAGGYCFEHNKLAFEALKQFGFDVKLGLARVIFNRDSDVPKTHRITLISLNGQQYLFDVGFGPLGAIYPLKMALNIPQQQGRDTYRISQNDKNEFLFQILKNGKFVSLYSFDTNDYSEADCELSHFYSSNHPDAAFVNNLVVARKNSEETHSLRNGEYHHITAKGSEITLIDSLQCMHDLLTEVFDFKLDNAISSFLFSKFACAKPCAQ